MIKKIEIENLNLLLRKNKDFYLLEHKDFFIVVTHGNENGEIQKMSGKLQDCHEATKNLLLAGKGKEVVVFACHEDKRETIDSRINLTPLNSVGEIKSRVMELNTDTPEWSVFIEFQERDLK